MRCLQSIKKPQLLTPHDQTWSHTKKPLTRTQIPHGLQATTHCGADLLHWSLKCLRAATEYQKGARPTYIQLITPLQRERHRTELIVRACSARLKLEQRGRRAGPNSQTVNDGFLLACKGAGPKQMQLCLPCIASAETGNSASF